MTTNTYKYKQLLCYVAKWYFSLKILVSIEITFIFTTHVYFPLNSLISYQVLYCDISQT